MLAVSACFWGTGFFWGKLALKELPVGPMLLYRFLFGCLGLLPFALARAGMRVRRADVPLFLAAAALGVPVQYIVQFEGLARTTVSHASLMIGMVPMILAGAAVLFTGERLDRAGWALLGFSTLGALLIALGARHGQRAAGEPTLLGDALVVLSLFGGVAWVLLSKRLMGPEFGYSAFAVNAWVIFIGTALLAVWVVAADGLPPVHLLPRTWLALVAPGLMVTALGSLLWNWGMARVPATQAAAFVNIDPVVGTLLGMALLGERLGATAVVGGVLILGAALTLALRGEASAPEVPPG